MDGSLNRRGWGFTLPEVLIALFLISVAMLAVLGVFIASLPLMAQNRESATASALARSLHERILAAGGVPNANQVFQGSVPDPPVGTFPPAPYPYLTVSGVPYTFRVTTIPLAGRTDVVTVEVQVDWGQGHKISQQCHYYVP